MRIGRFTLSRGVPAIMGIVNATPDSFSDGGLYLNPDQAVRHALRLEREGADIIDVGGESTRPGAQPVGTAEELRRVIPVIEGVRAASDVPISIDTTKSEVARAAVEAGADMINDISAGRFDEGMLTTAARLEVPICLMHMKGTPRTMQDEPRYDDLMGEVKGYLIDAMERAREAGVAQENVILDPGIGFGKTADDNLTIMRRLSEISALGAPVLIGTSRKSFIGKLLDVDIEKRLEGMLATLALAVDRGAQVLRVHDVAPARRFLSIYLACL